ncbi:MAG: nitroreductase family deazaflavin-dependent oxidoreductase [Chloroflexota bacterium]|nr:nitroreductase family deazaflavin-dependent oxidoreductase [Chloroflexota bacterium]
MANTFRPTFMTSLSNRVVTALLRLGLPIGQMALLTVVGRKSGLPRTTPVALVQRDGQRWVTSPYGEVDWVRNLRAAGRATVKRGRHPDTVTAVELPMDEAAVILQQTLRMAPAFIQAYYNVAQDAPLADFEREAPRHPVFRLTPVTAQQAGS